jgi:transcriptional regulator GlxA family with amidase domain
VRDHGRSHLHALSRVEPLYRAKRQSLAQLFRRETGTSVHKFLNKMRVRHPETLLLDSQMPVNAVASESGFATGQHFARIFKQVNGLQPLEFRRQHRRV